MSRLPYRPPLFTLLLYEYDMEKFGTLDTSEKTIANLGDGWMVATDGETGRGKDTHFFFCVRNVMSTQMWEVSLL